MASKRVTITLFGDQHAALERLLSELNRGRAEPVTVATVVRVALARLLDESTKNPLEVTRQFELPFG